MKETLTPEQLQALRQFAQANGRRWKSALNTLWMNGAYNNAVLGDADPGYLQQIRNTFGPTWLVRFSFKKVWVIVHLPPGTPPEIQAKIVAVCTSEVEAVTYIGETLEPRDPEGVHRGDYTIDGPCDFSKNS